MRPLPALFTWSALTIIAVTIASPRDARADTPRSTLGRAGQVVLDDLIGFRTGAPAPLGDLGFPVGIGRAGPSGGPSLGGVLGYGHFEGSTPGPGGTSFNEDVVWVAPSVDVFVVRRVSLGLSLGVSYSRLALVQRSSNTIGKSLSMAAMPRIGYAMPLGHGFSIWPRLGLGVAQGRTILLDASGLHELGASGTHEGRALSWVGGADLGLIFQATPHVFLAARPELTAWYTTSPSAPGVAFGVTLGGAVGLGVTL